MVSASMTDGSRLSFTSTWLVPAAFAVVRTRLIGVLEVQCRVDITHEAWEEWGVNKRQEASRAFDITQESDIGSSTSAKLHDASVPRDC